MFKKKMDATSYEFASKSKKNLCISLLAAFAENFLLCFVVVLIMAAAYMLILPY